MFLKSVVASSSGRTCEIEDFGEHHMGASHIRVRLDEPFLGVRDFHSTNGSAVSSPDGERLLVWDACVLLRLELQARVAWHCVPPTGWYIQSAQFDGPGITGRLGNERGSTREFGPLLAPDWRAGFGPANDGLLPSVHRPYHDALFG